MIRILKKAEAKEIAKSETKKEKAARRSNTGKIGDKGEGLTRNKMMVAMMRFMKR